MNIEWIPTEEKIPEQAGEYLACNDAGEVFIAQFSPSEERQPIWWNLLCVGYRPERVIAWMPVPQAYTEEGDDGYLPYSGDTAR